jgi:hypothetical protein
VCNVSHSINSCGLFLELVIYWTGDITCFLPANIVIAVLVGVLCSLSQANKSDCMIFVAEVPNVASRASSVC